jgi:hypothetical protein
MSAVNTLETASCLHVGRRPGREVPCTGPPAEGFAGEKNLTGLTPGWCKTTIVGGPKDPPARSANEEERSKTWGNYAGSKCIGDAGNGTGDGGSKTRRQNCAAGRNT